MIVEFRCISKAFGAVKANDSVSLSVPEASIQAIVGENGAGKSTLMKILSGYLCPDSGQILLDGKAVRINSPACALRLGIGMLHQDPLDFSPLTVLDNFILGSPSRFVPNRRKALEDLAGLAGRLGFSLSPDARIDALTVGERQQLEILRLLWLGAKVLILDEPTTGISLPQKEKLFVALKTLAAEGMSIFFVSHKLEDVESLCGKAAVLRQGILAGTMEQPFDSKELVRMMFGKDLGPATRSCRENGKPQPCFNLEVKNASMDGTRFRMKGIGLQVQAGEVIGLAGMEGSGQELFLGACGGLVPTSGGAICLGNAGKAMTGRTYHDFQGSGVGYLPAARLEKGLVPGLNLAEHYVLANRMPGFFIDRDKALDLADSRIAAFNIKGGPESPAESLSGGNQQRLLLSLLPDNLSLILIEHPTRGLDVESTIYVWAKLKERCAQGASIIFISSDLDEILQYSDRVMVFFAGNVTPPLDAESLNVQRLGELIGGKGWEALQGKKEAHQENKELEHA
ncbi:MAG: ATP-binding cassette domain-containing protein [Spirochaetaceae bacterium]|nr:ATP-binding cassette domain-containing protein [Spirochaetaceae bacterium]